MPDLPRTQSWDRRVLGRGTGRGHGRPVAALKVLHELRPRNTVTICLPLFLAGGEGDRAFARFHPTITVDGCELRCAARGTEMYSESRRRASWSTTSSRSSGMEPERASTTE